MENLNVISFYLVHVLLTTRFERLLKRPGPTAS
jgi:hypothetical protein